MEEDLGKLEQWAAKFHLFASQQACLFVACLLGHGVAHADRVDWISNTFLRAMTAASWQCGISWIHTTNMWSTGTSPSHTQMWSSVRQHLALPRFSAFKNEFVTPGCCPGCSTLLFLQDVFSSYQSRLTLIVLDNTLWPTSPSVL